MIKSDKENTIKLYIHIYIYKKIKLYSGDLVRRGGWEVCILETVPTNYIMCKCYEVTCFL